MAVSKIPNVRLRGIAAAVPEKVRSLVDEADAFSEEELAKVSESIGVQQRRVVSDLCTSDLCYDAAEKLIETAGVDKKCIDALVFVSQTPDYILPSTSCCLHGRLGLSKDCVAFDINLGCSGYVYGLWVLANMIASGSIQRAILLVGDTISKVVSPKDRASALIFGDAGTATLLERDNDAPDMTFVLGTNGEGQSNLKVPAGGFRQRWSEEASVRTEREDGNFRADTDLFMNGAEVFGFTLSVVPQLVKTMLSVSDKSIGAIDAFVFHQANRFMLQYLTRRMKIPAEKVVLGMESYGNTSSASIPLAITTHLAERARTEVLSLALAGFGVGYSWAGAVIETKELIIPDLIIVPETLLHPEDKGDQ